MSTGSRSVPGATPSRRVVSSLTVNPGIATTLFGPGLSWVVSLVGSSVGSPSTSSSYSTRA